MADNVNVAFVQNVMNLADSITGNFRLISAAAVNPIDGNTQISIVRVDPVSGDATKIGDFQMTAADWATLQAIYPSLTQPPLG